MRYVRHAHSTNATATSVTSSRTTASLSTCAPSTQTSHATVAYSGNARNCFRCTIHLPGLGSIRRHPGNHESSRNGSAMPMPSATNTSSVSAAGCDSAKPSAAPMNGAVHGEAITTASTPDSAAFTTGLCAVHPAADDGTSDANSNAPDRLSASTKKSTARLVTTAGRLQLESPAELLARRAEREEHAREQHERRDDARAEREALEPQLVLVAVSGRRERERLDRQHREHARHQVQHDPAQEREHERDARATVPRRPAPAAAR